VGDLTAGVHARVGAPGDDQPQRFWQPQHVPERLGKRPGYGPAPLLPRPPRETAPVISDFNLHPNGWCQLLITMRLGIG
jgi:hypothetical protein